MAEAFPVSTRFDIRCSCSDFNHWWLFSNTRSRCSCHFMVFFVIIERCWTSGTKSTLAVFIQMMLWTLMSEKIFDLREPIEQCSEWKTLAFENHGSVWIWYDLVVLVVESSVSQIGVASTFQVKTFAFGKNQKGTQKCQPSVFCSVSIYNKRIEIKSLHSELSLTAEWWSIQNETVQTKWSTFLTLGAKTFL